LGIDPDLDSAAIVLFPVDLLALLKWKAHPDRVMDILGRLRHVSGEEIVKVRVYRENKYAVHSE
jgi:hypothetical protein